MLRLKMENIVLCTLCLLFLFMSALSFGFRPYFPDYEHEDPVWSDMSEEEMGERFLDNIEERWQSYEDMKAWESEQMRLYQEQVEARRHKLDAMLERNEELAVLAGERLKKARTISDLYAEGERMRRVNMFFILIMLIFFMVPSILIFRKMRSARTKYQ